MNVVQHTCSSLLAAGGFSLTKYLILKVELNACGSYLKQAYFIIIRMQSMWNWTHRHPGIWMLPTIG